ncbi:D-alanine--D-alanine ligase family protein [Anaerolentibacter hominis]|uniref:D-alanine--D-alanine ligase family protein n=1 Tax=Anaerolentibacter hominis TaxID=3079009 RepID=UPI0031B891EE
MEKKSIAVLFGGQSSEHEVSLISAGTIIANIDKEKYQVLLIGITKEGRWLKADRAEDIPTGAWKESTVSAAILPDAQKKCAILMENGGVTEVKLDVVFPVLHGLCGEDGTIQGLLELAGIPYVGCGVVASGVSMDKFFTKVIADSLGIRQARYVPVLAEQFGEMERIVKDVEEKLGYPVFIKPSNAGSSRGVSKAHNREELTSGLHMAAEHDRKILVEETISGRELECAVLGGRDQVMATGVGEILAAADFYDYEAKYHSAESKTVLSPELPGDAAEEIRQTAMAVFRAVDGFGLSRVDFFLENGTNQVVFNEINTMPGFTGISMYPMLWEAEGVSKPELVERLIDLAFER